MGKSRNGYTQEQINKAVDMYVSRPDLHVADIAEQLDIMDPSSISHWVKDQGLPLRVSKSTGWQKNSTTSYKSQNKLITCPNCNKRYKPRDGQKFCHLCGADITPLDERCKNHLVEVYSYVNKQLVNPHTLQHSQLVESTKGLINLLKNAQPDLNKYFNN